MANTNINPFAPTGELPEGYPLSTSLDENNAQKAAAASSAYALKRMITGDYEVIDPNDLTKETLYIDPTNERWLISYAQQNNLSSVSYLLEGVKSIKVAWPGSGNLAFAIVTDATPVDEGALALATGESIRILAASQGEVEIDVPTDAYRVVFDWKSDFVENPFSFVVVKQESVVGEMIDEKIAGGTGLKNRIIVAASNTPEELAATADYKCTGTNDEVALNMAISDAIAKGFGVLLLRGDYYLDAPTKTYNTSNDTFLLVDTSPQNGGSSRSITIEGENPARNITPYIHLSDSAYEALDSTKQYSLIAVYDSSQYGGFVEMKNIFIRLPYNQKKVCALDFLNFGGYARLQSLSLYAYTNGYNNNGTPVNVTISDPPAVAAEGCIGIRFIGKGPNGTYASEMSNISVCAFNEGICINTEWTICSHVVGVFCNYAWVFGKYTSSGIHAQCHPTVLICCGDERGVNLPLFYHSTNGLQNIDMIAFSIERNAANTPGGVLGNYATERVQGSTRGRIDYTQGQASNSTTARFWEYGHGHNMTTRNMAHAASGTTTIRNGYNPNYLQRYYDTTIGEELVCVDEQNKVWKSTMATNDNS